MGQLFEVRRLTDDKILSRSEIAPLMRNYDEMRNMINDVENENYFELKGEKVDEFLCLGDYQEHYGVVNFKPCSTYDYYLGIFGDAVDELYTIINCMYQHLIEASEDIDFIIKNSSIDGINHETFDVYEMLEYYGIYDSRYFSGFENLNKSIMEGTISILYKKFENYAKQCSPIIDVIEKKFFELINKKDLKSTYYQNLSFSKKEILTIFEIYELTIYLCNLIIYIAEFIYWYDGDYICYDFQFYHFAQKLERLFDLNTLKTYLKIEPIKLAL